MKVQALPHPLDDQGVQQLQGMHLFQEELEL
jgi:hypothetical protein